MTDERHQRDGEDPAGEDLDESSPKRETLMDLDLSKPEGGVIKGGAPSVAHGCPSPS
jgi:hypothetical protein